MKPIYIDYLNALDIEALAMTDAEIIGAVETGLVAQGNGQTVIEPRVHLEPDPSFHGHFNVLRGYVAPLDAAGHEPNGCVVEAAVVSDRASERRERSDGCGPCERAWKQSIFVIVVIIIAALLARKGEPATVAVTFASARFAFGATLFAGILSRVRFVLRRLVGAVVSPVGRTVSVDQVVSAYLVTAIPFFR